MSNDPVSIYSGRILKDEKLNDAFMLTRDTEISKTLVGFYVLLTLRLVTEIILTFSQWELYKEKKDWVIVNMISEAIILVTLITIACKCKSQKSSTTQLGVLLLFNLI